jgi:hypothetical protein
MIDAPFRSVRAVTWCAIIGQQNTSEFVEFRQYKLPTSCSVTGAEAFARDTAALDVGDESAKMMMALRNMNKNSFQQDMMEMAAEASLVLMRKSQSR